jgi:hypothetical protein
MAILKKSCLMQDGSNVQYETLDVFGDAVAEEALSMGFHRVNNRMRDRIEWVRPLAVAQEAQRRINEAVGYRLADFMGFND